MTDEDKRPPKNAEEAIEAFLGIAMVHPEKEPKTQRAQRENEATIIGFNRAQETLRDILGQVEGRTKQAERAQKLADVRSENQRKPMEGPGGMRIWVVN